MNGLFNYLNLGGRGGSRFQQGRQQQQGDFNTMPVQGDGVPMVAEPIVRPPPRPMPVTGRPGMGLQDALSHPWALNSQPQPLDPAHFSHLGMASPINFSAQIRNILNRGGQSY